MGKNYVPLGYPVLMTLIFPYTLMLIQSASARVLFGMSKHGKLAVVTMIEGVANLALSVWLVRPYGVLGDAIGTAIPLAGTYLLFMPCHLCSRLGIRVSSFVRQAYLLPLLSCAPMVAVLLLMQRWFVPHTYRQLALQLLIGGVVYGACVTWAYLSGQALYVGNLATLPDKPHPDAEVSTPPIETFPDEI